MDHTYELMMELGRELGDTDTQDAAVSRIVALTVDAIQAPLGGMTMLRPGARLETLGATHQVVEQVDHDQYRLREGPCVEAVVDTRVVTSPDVRTDPRWPRWGPLAAELGVCSVLSVQLMAGGSRIGALNLYDHERRAFEQPAIEVAKLYAVTGSAVLGFASRAENLNIALSNRTIIGQAQGIMMNRYDLDADRAFEVLRRHSQDSNVRLADLARQVVRTRALPGVGSDEPAR